MKISKSKRQLAQLLIEAGVKKFPNGADWAAQGSLDIKVSFYGGYKPKRGFGEAAFCGSYCGSRHDVQLPSLINNWHQTVLSRDEFDQIVAETAPDADGWIEWNGGECPVLDEHGVARRRDRVELAFGPRNAYNWRHDESCPSNRQIVAYRLHRPEQAKTEFCESVMRTIPDPEAKPTIDQLLQDWRNADDFAKRKQAEADEAAAMRDERWKAVQAKAGEMGVTIGACDSVASEHKLEITDWRDLQLNDIIEYVDGDIKDKIGMTGPVVEFAPDATDGMMVRMKCDNGPRKGLLGWPMKWRFIRRP